MPQLRYTLHVYGEQETFRETDLFPRTQDVTKLVKSEIVDKLNDKRKKLGEALIELVNVEVLNPHIHQHEWSRTHINRSTLRAIYVCRQCDVVGYKPYHIVDGETSSHVTRDEAFKNEKFAICRDPLKEAPKKLSFI